VNTFDKLYRVADDDVTAMRLANLGPAPKVRTMSDDELLRKGMARQLERQPHSIGSADPDRKRELGEIEVDLGTERRRIRIAHDPEQNAMYLHGIATPLSGIDRDLGDAFVASAGALNAAQGEMEQATQAAILGAVVSAVLRRHQFLADAVVQQLRHERYHSL
jgi:hypothetical protein